MHLALHPVPAASDGRAHLAPAPAPFDPIAAAHDLAARLAVGAAERDRQWIRASGLLALSVPREYGGLGASWKTIGDAVRIVARADGALARLLGFHHVQVAGIRLAGNARQQRRLLFETIEQDVFWGDALDPPDRRLVARPTAGGYVLDGAKGLDPGAAGSDWLTVSAWDPLAHGTLVAVLPTQRDGVAVHAGSGTVSFTNVRLTEDDVLQPAARAATPQAALRAQVAQLVLTNVCLGLAEGALRDEARPRLASRRDVAGATDDPDVQHRLGKLRERLRPAQALADAAAVALDDAFAWGPHLTARVRGEAAGAIAEAQAVAHQAASEIGSHAIELAGAPRHRVDATLPESAPYPTAYA